MRLLILEVFFPKSTKRLFWPGFPDLAIPGFRVRKWRNPPHFSIKEMGVSFWLPRFQVMTIWRLFVLHRICGASFTDACRDSDHSHSSVSMNDVRAFFFYFPGINSNWLNDFFYDAFWLLFAEGKTNSRKTHHFCSTKNCNNNNNNFPIKKCTHTKGASFLLG